MKEKLSNKFGSLGYVLFFISSVVFTFAPLLVLHFPFWADLLIIAGVSLIPIVGTIANLGLWAWAAYVAWNEPLSWNVVFWVVLALDILFFLFPLFLLLLEKLGVLAEKIKSPKGTATTDTYETYLVCPSCGSLVHQGEVCSSCGYQFELPKRKKFLVHFGSHPYLIFIIFLLCIGGGYAIGQYEGYHTGYDNGYDCGYCEVEKEKRGSYLDGIYKGSRDGYTLGYDYALFSGYDLGFDDRLYGSPRYHYFENSGFFSPTQNQSQILNKHIEEHLGEDLEAIANNPHRKTLHKIDPKSSPQWHFDSN